MTTISVRDKKNVKAMINRKSTHKRLGEDEDELIKSSCDSIERIVTRNQDKTTILKDEEIEAMKDEIVIKVRCKDSSVMYLLYSIKQHKEKEKTSLACSKDS